MCIPKPYENKPCPLAFRLHLLGAHCITTFALTNGDECMCNNCFEIYENSADFQPGILHWLTHGVNYTTKCTRCQRELLESRPASECYWCFLTYYNIIQTLAVQNYGPETIQLPMVICTLTQNVIRLEIERPNPPE